MASLRFPDTGTRLVITPSGAPVTNAHGYLYADRDLTIPAEVYKDINGTKGPLYPQDEDGRVSIALNTRGEQVDYWGPADGTDRLWIVVNGVVSRVDADYNARIDALETAYANQRISYMSMLERVEALETGNSSTSYGFSPSSSPGAVTADDTAAGITYNSGVLTVDDILAPGVSYAAGVLTVTTA